MLISKGSNFDPSMYDLFDVLLFIDGFKMLLYYENVVSGIFKVPYY